MALTCGTVVDSALEVVEEYQSKILKLEQSVLLKPNMKHVRRRKCFLLFDSVVDAHFGLQCTFFRVTLFCTSAPLSQSRLSSTACVVMMSTVSRPCQSFSTPRSRCKGT